MLVNPHATHNAPGSEVFRVTLDTASPPSSHHESSHYVEVVERTN